MARSLSGCASGAPTGKPPFRRVCANGFSYRRRPLAGAEFCANGCANGFGSLAQHQDGLLAAFTRNPTRGFRSMGSWYSSL